MKSQHSDVDSLTIICNGLDINIQGLRKKSHIISKLASCYCFPCFPSESHYPILSHLSPNECYELNVIINKTLSHEFITQLPYNCSKSHHFYRSNDDTHIYIIKKDVIFSATSLQHLSSYQSHDMYKALQWCFIRNSTNQGVIVRQRLLEFLQPMSRLFLNFLTETAGNNKNMAMSNNVDELSNRLQLSLLPDNEPYSNNYLPDTIQCILED